ncbi:hypothetical protein Salat_0399000 [Sesamum alatum]|uniref:Phytosulfokine n=1 Tax=Sesamum alatum TaxID=300844 RepID=A0AAE1Z3B1_9LAMI|nr:hypothetical protein Salat_0399000 [Sesamum alatum]
MKHKYDSVSVVLFLAVLVIITTSNITSAAPRKLAAAKQDVNTNNLSSSSNDHSLPKMQTLDSFYKLMGLEEYCQNGDEECLKRRAIAEAHLDYIYTQHHKP